MPDSLDDLLDPSTPDSGQSGGQLRKQLEQVLAQNKQLQDQLAQVAQRERQTSLNALFTKHAVPAKAADFFPTDTDPTDEAVTAFVEKYGDLWGASAAPASTPPAEQAATSAAQQFVSQTQAQPVSLLTEEQYAAKFAEAKTKEEFLQMLAEFTAAAAG